MQILMQIPEPSRTRLIGEPCVVWDPFWSVITEGTGPVLNATLESGKASALLEHSPVHQKKIVGPHLQEFKPEGFKPEF